MSNRMRVVIRGITISIVISLVYLAAIQAMADAAQSIFDDRKETPEGVMWSPAESYDVGWDKEDNYAIEQTGSYEDIIEPKPKVSSRPRKRRAYETVSSVTYTLGAEPEYLKVEREEPPPQRSNRNIILFNVLAGLIITSIVIFIMCEQPPEKPKIERRREPRVYHLHV